MKLIEALKELKRLQIKLTDLTSKVHTYCADYDYETPAYENQSNQIREWVQGYEDTCKRILELRIALQKTNLVTMVTIELGGRQVTKSIAEWVHRRRDLAKLQMGIWSALGDRNLKEGTIKTSTGESREVKIRRYYSPRDKDEHMSALRDEPSLVDATLEVVNAVTDLVEN